MKMSAVLFLETICLKAIEAKKTIVLPEYDCQRIQDAAKAVEERGIAKIILPRDVKNSPDFDEFVQTYYELRREKGVTLDQARETMADPSFFSTMMVYKGKADGMVAGAEHTTAATIRPALQFVKTKPGVTLVSGAFFMCLNNTVWVFADCAVNPSPNAQCLAEIAVETAATAAAFGIEPRVAMLSYSTGKSGQGPSVDMVRQATEIALKINPSLIIDGPIQFDAAVDPATAKLKLPDSKVAGQATVFVFPDLDAGNIACKAVQRSTGCLAIGPILQGLNKPVNDLSRGCTVDDIINTIAVTAV
ncbi:MAG: phosphate acetyltransferase, partial [Alphaproteobacteria bacterium]|nr:phosphate acetyltransferase [Alphaproteobacteria bacterium]